MLGPGCNADRDKERSDGFAFDGEGNLADTFNKPGRDGPSLFDSRLGKDNTELVASVAEQEELQKKRTGGTINLSTPGKVI